MAGHQLLIEGSSNAHLTSPRVERRRDDAPVVVDIVIPVHNEERILATSVQRLHEHLRTTMPYAWRITIVDNASTDATLTVAYQLAATLDCVRVLHLDRKGRGLALKAAWGSSDAAVLAYTDVDLSTGLDALLPLVAPLVSGHSDVAIGSRLARGSSVARGPRRELISRLYNLILRSLFAARFSDAQCGFKAVRADAAAVLLPEIDDDGWFFDTELLLLADHNEFRIHEVAVDWVDDPDSRVDVTRTAIDDLKGVARMARRFASGGGRIDEAQYRRAHVDNDMGRQLVMFALIGATCTAISLALFLVLRELIGPVGANALAVTATALANLWANRRYTFGRRDRAGRARDYLTGIAVYVGGLILSTVALLTALGTGGGLPAELFAILIAWSLTALCRFAFLRDRTRSAARTGSNR